MEQILRQQAQVRVLKPARDKVDWVLCSVVTGDTENEVSDELIAY